VYAGTSGGLYASPLRLSPISYRRHGHLRPDTGQSPCRTQQFPGPHDLHRPAQVQRRMPSRLLRQPADRCGPVHHRQRRPTIRSRTGFAPHPATAPDALHPERRSHRLRHLAEASNPSPQHALRRLRLERLKDLHARAPAR